MQAVATETATWITVRCPCRRKTVLADVRGDAGEIRRRCPSCKGWWVVDVRTGVVRGADLLPAGVRASG